MTRIHRSKFEIVSKILTLCKKPTLRTHIMYQANLSFYMLKEYEKLLLGQGYLKKFTDADNTTRFTTTEKGLEFLGSMSEWKDLLAIEVPA